MQKLLGASWRTSATGWLGLLSAIGSAAELLRQKNYNFNSPEWLAVGSAFVSSIGLLNARDNKVSSEAAGAVIPAPAPAPQPAKPL